MLLWFDNIVYLLFGFRDKMPSLYIGLIPGGYSIMIPGLSLKQFEHRLDKIYFDNWSQKSKSGQYTSLYN